MDEFRLLLIEDSPSDREFAKLALIEVGTPHVLITAQDGDEALKLLAQDPLPSLIVLDLNLPGIPGLELLQELRKNPRTKLLPVIVLTSSQRDDDVTRSYEAHCNAYMRKPFGYDDIVRNYTAIRDFWFRAVTLPGHTQPIIHAQSEPPEG